MDRAGPNWTALAIVAGLHALAVALLMTATHVIVQREAETPLAVTLMPEVIVPPPVAAPPEAPPPPLAVTRSRAILSRPDAPPSPPPPDPASIPAAPTYVAAPPTPAAPGPPAPRPAPPSTAPITPPVFDAAYLNNPAPTYPPQSRRVREEGEVVLRVRVSEAGRASEVRVDRSSGHRRLDRAAIAAVRGWRFVPAQQDGQPREAWVLVPLAFSLSRG